MSIKVEALDKGGKAVGVPAPGPRVNPSTNLVEFEPGQVFKLTLAMEEEFEGSFQVVASDPVTGVVYAEIKLQTAYL